MIATAARLVRRVVNVVSVDRVGSLLPLNNKNRSGLDKGWKAFSLPSVHYLDAWEAEIFKRIFIIMIFLSSPRND
jgi:hypothetical protein